MEQNNYFIYMHINKINRKRYIGQTCQTPEKRWKENGEGYKRSPCFYNAIKKYGWDNFEHHIIISGLNVDEANKLEKLFISVLNTYVDNKNCNGYNLTSGGDNKYISEESRKKMSLARQGRESPSKGYRWTDEQKRKFSEKQKGIGAGVKNPFYGKKHNEETKRKISEANKGHTHTEEWKKMMSIRFSGEHNPNYNKKASLETRQKLSESHKGIKQTEEAIKKRADANRGKKRTKEQRERISAANTQKIPIIAINIKTNEEFQFESLSDAARTLNLDIRNMPAVLKGRVGHIKGYKLFYKNNK